MSEYYPQPDEISNPYAVAPARTDLMPDQQRSDYGNALASTEEAMAIAEIKASIATAKMFPRDPLVSMNNVLYQCQRSTLANNAVYSFPRGKETVSGPSIRLAEVLAQSWGNIEANWSVIERKPSVGKKPGTSTIVAYCWDKETNYRQSRKFEVQHIRHTKSGDYPITDDRDIYELEANMAARRVRSCILSVIPGDVIEAAVAACRKTTSNAINEMMSDKQKRVGLINQMIRIYGKMGVTQEDLETYLNAKADDWTADHMLRLKEIKTSLEENGTPLGDYFPRLATENQNDVISKDQVKKLMEAAKATGKQGDISVELKRMGIAKFADVPSGKYDAVLAMIQAIGSADEKPTEIEAPAEDQPQQDEQ